MEVQIKTPINWGSICLVIRHKYRLFVIKKSIFQKKNYTKPLKNRNIAQNARLDETDCSYIPTTYSLKKTFYIFTHFSTKTAYIFAMSIKNSPSFYCLLCYRAFISTIYFLSYEKDFNLHFAFRFCGVCP